MNTTTLRKVGSAAFLIGGALLWGAVELIALQVSRFKKAAPRTH